MQFNLIVAQRVRPWKCPAVCSSCEWWEHVATSMVYDIGNLTHFDQLKELSIMTEQQGTVYYD